MSTLMLGIETNILLCSSGVCFGPLLFLIYINDLPNISNKLDLYLFADDTNIYYADESLGNLEKKVNKELKKPLSVAEC